MFLESKLYYNKFINKEIISILLVSISRPFNKNQYALSLKTCVDFTLKVMKNKRPSCKSIKCSLSIKINFLCNFIEIHLKNNCKQINNKLVFAYIKNYLKM